MTDRKIILPRELDFTEFEKDFLKKLDKIISSDVGISTVIFNFTKTTWVDLMEVMCLSVAVDYLHKKKKCKSRFIFPKQGSNVRDFLRDWDIIDFLSKKGTSNISTEMFQAQEVKYILDKFVPVKSIGSEIDITNMKKDLAENLGTHFPILRPEGISSFCNKIFYEITKNILDHAYGKEEKQRTTLVGMRNYYNLISKREREGEDKSRINYFLSKLPAWMRALMKRDPEVTSFLELVIIDGGKGLLENLKEEFWIKLKEKLSVNGTGRDPLPYEVNDKRILEYVFLKGGLSTHPERDKDPRRGYGLYWAREYVNGWGGCIYIRTGKAAAVISSNYEISYQKKDYFLPGVQYRIFLPVSDKVKVEEINRNQTRWERTILKH